MIRGREKRGGKFLLAKDTRFGGMFYRESGIVNVGTPNEEVFVHWTKYPENAKGFKTWRMAQAVADKLWHEHGERAFIFTIKG